MLTNKAKYGLKALAFLAMHQGKGVQGAEIASAYAMPKKFLDAILLQIKNIGIIQSKKGRGGGYQLSRPPDTISLGQVIRELDGPFAPVPCVSRSAYARCSDCPDETACIIRPVMQEVRDAISVVLDNRTLADMLNAKQDAEQFLTYDI